MGSESTPTSTPTDAAPGQRGLAGRGVGGSRGGGGFAAHVEPPEPSAAAERRLPDCASSSRTATGASSRARAGSGMIRAADSASADLGLASWRVGRLTCWLVDPYGPRAMPMEFLTDA